MIIFANGAQKSGSTWLMHIALQLRPCVEPPQEYWNPRWKSRPHYSIDHPKLKAFLADPRLTGSDVMVKFHHDQVSGRNAMLARPDVRVLNIRRDPRDVVVSAYYHRRKEQADQRDFADYYWSHGRGLAWRILLYHMVWNIASPRYLRVEYEDLLTDFAGQVRRIAALLEVPVTDERIAEIQRNTSPEAISEQFAFSDLNRFRKGGSGDWQNHLTAAHLADIERLTAAAHRLPTRLAFSGPRPVRWLLKRWSKIPRRAALALPAGGR
jgi:hypothetical protein